MSSLSAIFGSKNEKFQTAGESILKYPGFVRMSNEIIRFKMSCGERGFAIFAGKRNLAF